MTFAPIAAINQRLNGFWSELMARLKWGMIGGGEGSQIGPVHRISSAIDGRFELTARSEERRVGKEC